MAHRFRRLEALLGCSPEAVTGAALQRLVEMTVDEDFDLDLKGSLYRQDDKGKDELAKDVAAMAERGGVIVLGVHGKDSGQAMALVALELSESVANSMRQVVASRVFPLPEYDLKAVPSDGEQGQWLIVVPPSNLAPHAVASPGQATLRYVVRDGATTRALSESEVADRYRRRFRQAEDQLARAERVFHEGQARLSLLGQSWLAMAVVPDRPGEVAITTDSLDRHRRWCELWQQNAIQSRVNVQAVRSQTVGFRRLIVTADLQPFQGESQFGHYELHADGAAFAAVRLGAVSDAWLRPVYGEPEIPEGDHVIEQGDLALAVLDMVSLLAGQVVDFAGGGGDGTILAQLVIGGDQDGTIERRGLHLLEVHPEHGTRRVPATRRLTATSLSTHTVALPDVMTGPGELVVASRAVTLDLLSEFGQGAWDGWRTDGSVDASYFGRAAADYAAQWAKARNLLVLNV